jgi:glycosyltransferase involved in cell wall biosynthesis
MHMTSVRQPTANKKNHEMNVLHLIGTSGPGGAENVLINLAGGLKKRGHQSVAVLRKRGWLYDELMKNDIETIIIHEEGMFDFTFLIKLLALIKKKKISHIHAHEFLMSLYGAVVGLLAAKPVITTFHGKNYYWEKARRRIIMRWVSRLSSMVAVSDDLRAFLSDKVGIRKQRVQTIYNGVDVNKYNEVAPGTDEKRLLHVQETDTIVGTVGNLYVVKGQTYLLKAIPAVLRSRPNTVFLFAGRGDQEGALRSEAKSLGIEDNVRFLGFRSDVPRLLGIMDIFILPSLSECLPLSVLEAMVMGVPSIVTDVGGNREIIDDTQTGYIVPPANPEALAEKILFLLNDTERAKKMGEKAREAITTHFSLPAMIDKYETLYRSL